MCIIRSVLSVVLLVMNMPLANRGRLGPKKFTVRRIRLVLTILIPLAGPTIGWLLLGLGAYLIRLILILYIPLPPFKNPWAVRDYRWSYFLLREEAAPSMMGNRGYGAVGPRFMGGRGTTLTRAMSRVFRWPSAFT